MWVIEIFDKESLWNLHDSIECQNWLWKRHSEAKRVLLWPGVWRFRTFGGVRMISLGGLVFRQSAHFWLRYFNEILITPKTIGFQPFLHPLKSHQGPLFQIFLEYIQWFEINVISVTNTYRNDSRSRSIKWIISAIPFYIPLVNEDEEFGIKSLIRKQGTEGEFYPSLGSRYQIYSL